MSTCFVIKIQRRNPSTARSQRSFYSLLPLHPFPCVGIARVGKRERASFFTRTPTHHVILYESIRYIRHLVQRIGELLAFDFPPRSGKPAWYVLHCPQKENKFSAFNDDWRRECDLRAGTTSTRKACGSKKLENWRAAVSTRST